MSASEQSSGKIPLEMNNYTVKEIVEAVHRLFMLHSENITFQFHRTHIQILVFPEKDAPFLDVVGPLDISLHEGGKQEWINL